VLSPNERVLFVAMTRDNAIWRIPLLPDGSIAKVGHPTRSYVDAHRAALDWIQEHAKEQRG